jgi:thiol-disulfide isomerase/thioredoxin
VGFLLFLNQIAMKSVLMVTAFLWPVVLFGQEKKDKNEQSFTIEGTVAQLQKPAKVYLSMRTKHVNKLDSTEVKDGKFVITGTLEEPSMAYLVMKVQDSTLMDTPHEKKRDVLTVFIEKGTIHVDTQDSINNAKVTGSASNDDFIALNSLLKDVTSQLNELQAQYRQLYMSKDEEGMKKLEPRFDELEASQKKIMGDYLKNNSGSPIALFVLGQYAGYEINPAEIEPIYNKLNKSLRNTPSGKQFAGWLAVAKKTAVGQPGMDFAQPDADGKNVSLTAFKGKYVLVDFWASWCGPCRAENPNVLKAYSKFKDKGFDVLAISIDEKKDKWLAAVQADNLPWTHVSDLKGWNNAAAELYGIRAIPQNVLINPEGMIVAKNLRGDALEKKLEEILK